MPRIPAPRAGLPVKIKSRPLSFSYWPMYKSSRRYGLQSNIFATNPWALMHASTRERAPTLVRPEAFATLLQAEQFFRAAVNASLWSAKPLLLYYSFMNLAKALCLTNRVVTSFDQAQHGMTEQLRLPARKELVDAYLKAFPSPTTNGKRNIFADLLSAIADQKLTAIAEYDIPALLPQIVTGHRIWCDASNKRERFVSVDRIEVMENTTSKSLWLRLNIFADDLTRLGLSHRQLLEESGLKGTWQEVTPDEDMITDRKILRFEQKSVKKFTGRPSDSIPSLIEDVRHQLWATVTSVPPYRKYYLYLSPQVERKQVLPQLLSLYALVYYLSSITRYRPQHFDSILAGRFGEQIQEILTNQPNQFLYLIASEFAEREVTRAAIV